MTKFTRPFLIFSVLAFAFPVMVQAQQIDPKNIDKECPGAARISGEFDSVMRFYDKKGVYIPCDKTNLNYRVRKAFYQIKNPGGIHFASTRFNFKMVGMDAWRFVNKKSQHVFIGGDPKKSEVMVPGFAGFVEGNDSKKKHNVMSIGTEAIYSTDLELRATIIHLAAHYAEETFSHKKCLRGPFALLPDGEEKACDVEWWNGAFVAEAEYFVSQAGASNLPAETRAEARAAAIERLTYHLNRLPGFLKPGAVLYPAQGGVLFFDGENITPMIARLPPGFEVANREDRITLVDQKKRQVMDYDFKGGFTNRKDLSELVKSGAKEVYRDIADIGDMTCVLFSSKILCQSKFREKEVATLTLAPGLKKFAWVREKASLEPNEERHELLVHVIKEDGSALRMANTFQDFKAAERLTAAPFVPPSIPNEVERIFLPKWSDMEHDVVALDKSGRIFSSKIRETTDTVWANSISTNIMVETPELKGQKFRKISGPMIWSKLLEEI